MLADLRDDVQADAALVGLLRGGTDLGLGVILVPVCQPVPEGHLRSNLLRLQSAAFLLELLELLDALLLRFGEDIFRFGIAVIIIADDDSPLPTAILALPYGSVPGFSLSCHGFNSFPKISSMKPPTMPQACLLHIRCDMGVGVQREGGVGVAQDAGQCFGVHTAGEGMGGEGMSQIMKADTGQTRPLEQRLHVAIRRVGIDGVFRLHWVGEYPLADGIRSCAAAGCQSRCAAG